MKTVSFQDIKHELISNMRRNMLIPIIGSGFTRNCKSFRGVVPSGHDYREYMIGMVSNVLGLSIKDQEDLEKDTFSNISSIYHRVVPKDHQEEYLSNNFTRVSIEEYKQRFLSLPWPYIYTLNIDDGIENGSDYSHIVYANRRFNEKVFDDKKCVIKLHGDVSDMLTYRDSTSEIFTQEQYVASLRDNKPLLSKLGHDGRYLNIIFIGCSLDDEIDILSSFLLSGSEETQTAKYICLVEKPSVLDAIKYEKYGITHCILFDSYDEIYNQLYLAGIEAQEITEDDLEDYRSFSFKRLSSGYEDNKPYLLFGKSLIDKNHTVTIPYFFISREVSATIINNLSSYNLQLLVGGRCSGKTYVLADVALKIRDRDVYFFETKDRLSHLAFERLLHKENCVILADNTAISNEQFEMLLNNLDLLKKNRISIVVVINKNNRDVNGILKLYEMQGKVSLRTVPQIGVSSTLTLSELSAINPLLTAVDAGIFSGKKTLLDNIIGISEKLAEKNKYYQVAPKLRTIQELSALISLGVERKVYSDRAVKLDISESLVTQHKVTEPLIDCESTWSFERSFGDSSPVKYVINGEYWLFSQLEAFAQISSNHKMIVEAYRHIITKIITQEGQPDLLYSNSKTSYKEYILFDNINRLFSFRKTSGRNGLALIRVIYEGLNDLLSVDPNYMHQRAKCYIKSSYYESENSQKHAFLDKAYRDANVALQVFTHRYEEVGNDKLLISIDHIKYTQALILSHKCYINSYSNIDENTLAIQTLYQALVSPYNSYDFAKSDAFNYSNVIGEIVTNTIANKNLVHTHSHGILENLFNLIATEA